MMAFDWRRVMSLASMAALFASRLGVAALGILLLPLFNALLSPAAFGLVATVIALQTFGVLFDLGLATSIGREMPVLSTPSARRALLRRGERPLLLGYGILGVVAGLLGLGDRLAFGGIWPLAVVVATLVVVWQNLILVALIGQKRFVASSTGQLGGLILRHGSSLALLVHVERSFESFVLGQLIGGIAALAVTRYHFMKVNVAAAHTKEKVTVYNGIVNLGLLIYSAAAAGAMQLDKPVLALVSSPESAGAYFLATTIALVPITFLAGPIAQFVQPRLIASVSEGSSAHIALWLVRLVTGTCILALIPTLVLGVFIEEFVALWLGGAPNATVVALYAAAILPGAAFGSLGFGPALILLARKDYRFLAANSCVLTGAVLAATYLLGARSDIEGVCVAYALYHAASAAVLWIRAVYVEPAIRPSNLAMALRHANSGR